MSEQLKEKATDAWHRELNDGRVEIMCRTPRHRIRVTAPEDEAWEAVELFERWTGVTVQSDRRPRRRPPVMEGQLSMMELESERTEEKEEGISPEFADALRTLLPGGSHAEDR